jgi:acetylornithine deacetylase/succinyl-diaminopimelate desuccinylase-like protein
MDKVIDFINTHRDRYVDELKEYLAIPSISALPQHQADVRRCAEWTVEEMRRIGLQNVRLIETPGNPVVYGDWLGADGAPTILFYGHYDVQPVDPLELWESPPFEATVRDGEIYARGSADDKGQVFMHFKAIEAHLKQNGRLPVNMRIILEGEEEVGSENLDTFVKDHKNDLAADVVVISDSPMFDRGIPSICYGLRGLIYYQLDLRGTKSDLHSGSFGGAVANPATVLSQILSQMKDKSGRIKIPETARRAGLLHARTCLGPTHVRGKWSAVGIHRRRRKNRDPRGRHGQGQHATGAGSGPGQDCQAVRSAREQSGAEDGRAQSNAHARRQAVDDRLSQPLRTGGGARD